MTKLQRISRLVEIIIKDPTITNKQLRERGHNAAHINQARKIIKIKCPRSELLTQQDMHYSV